MAGKPHNHYAHGSIFVVDYVLLWFSAGGFYRYASSALYQCHDCPSAGAAIRWIRIIYHVNQWATLDITKTKQKENNMYRYFTEYTWTTNGHSETLWLFQGINRGFNSISICTSFPVIIMRMGPANERRRYVVTSFIVGWAHTQNDLWFRIPVYANGRAWGRE